LRLAARYGDAIDRVYMRADSLVGQVRSAATTETTLLVVSDHGFASFRKA
jgi:predicted AlkP superfamily phosphohydrolase/phosphomutase